MTLVPALLWMNAAQQAAECTCTHADHSICPMHHKRAPGSRCVMQSADASGTAVLTALFGAVGLVPAPVRTADPDPRGDAIVLDTNSAYFRSAPPDPPPPRL